MLRIEEAISVLTGATHITVMDVKKGFHQIQVEEKSRILIRIVTHQGVYKYQRILFVSEKSASSIPEDDGL